MGLHLAYRWGILEFFCKAENSPFQFSEGKALITSTRVREVNLDGIRDILTDTARTLGLNGSTESVIDEAVRQVQAIVRRPQGVRINCPDVSRSPWYNLILKAQIASIRPENHANILYLNPRFDPVSCTFIEED